MVGFDGDPADKVRLRRNEELVSHGSCDGWSQSRVGSNSPCCAPQALPLLPWLRELAEMPVRTMADAIRLRLMCCRRAKESDEGLELNRCLGSGRSGFTRPSTVAQLSENYLSSRGIIWCERGAIQDERRREVQRKRHVMSETPRRHCLLFNCVSWWNAKSVRCLEHPRNTEATFRASLFTWNFRSGTTAPPVVGY
jgi:hypothetical protein